MESIRRIEIWFFIGSLLSVYGLLILGAGIYHLINPPPQHITLHELHSDLWWGVLLLVLGLFYCVRFWPFGKIHSERGRTDREHSTHPYGDSH